MTTPASEVLPGPQSGHQPLPIIIMCNTDIWARPPPVTHLTQVEGLYSLYLLLYTCTPYHAASHPCTAVHNNTDILSVCVSISVTLHESYVYLSLSDNVIMIYKQGCILRGLTIVSPCVTLVYSLVTAPAAHWPLDR